VTVLRPGNFERSDKELNPRHLALLKLTWVQHSNHSFTKIHKWGPSRKPSQSCFSGLPSRHVTKWLFWSLAILWNSKRDRTQDLSLWISWLNSNTLTNQPPSSTDELGVESLVNCVFLVNTLDTWHSDFFKPWQVWVVWAEIKPMTSHFGLTRDRMHDLSLWWCWLEFNTLITRPRSSTDELGVEGLVNRVFLVNPLNTWPLTVLRPGNFEKSDRKSNPRPFAMVKLTWV